MELRCELFAYRGSSLLRFQRIGRRCSRAGAMKFFGEEPYGTAAPEFQANRVAGSAWHSALHLSAQTDYFALKIVNVCQLGCLSLFRS